MAEDQIHPAFPDAKVQSKPLSAADPKNLFGDKHIKHETVEQDTPVKDGENLDADAVNAPRDAGSAFNVRTSVRAIPRRDPIALQSEERAKQADARREIQRQIEANSAQQEQAQQ